MTSSLSRPRDRTLTAVAVATMVVAGCSSGGGPAVRPTHPTGLLLSSYALSGRPHGVAALANGTFCVSQIDASTVTCGHIDTTSVIFSNAIPVGATPAHVALNSTGTTAYTANQSGNSVSFVNVSNAHVANLAIGDAGFNLLVAPGDRRVYVTSASGILTIVDAEARSVVRQLSVGSYPNGLALDAAAGLLYVSAINAGTVTVVNTSTNTVNRSFGVSALPQRIALSRDRRTLFVANESSGLEAVDVTSGTATPDYDVAAGAVGLAITPDGEQLYVANPPLGLVQIVDAATGEVVRTLTNMGRPRNVTFSLDGRVALVTDEFGALRIIR